MYYTLFPGFIWCILARCFFNKASLHGCVFLSFQRHRVHSVIRNLRICIVVYAKSTGSVLFLSIGQFYSFQRYWYFYNRTNFDVLKAPTISIPANSSFITTSSIHSTIPTTPANSIIRLTHPVTSRALKIRHRFENFEGPYKADKIQHIHSSCVHQAPLAASP